MSRAASSKHILSENERRIMDRYCARLEEQGDDKTGLFPSDLKEIIEAIDGIKNGATKISALNASFVAMLALTKNRDAKAPSVGEVTRAAQDFAQLILSGADLFDNLRAACCAAPMVKKQRGPRTDNALRSMVSSLAEEWERKNELAEPVAVTFNDKMKTVECGAADYILQVTESYFGDADKRLLSINFESVCSQIKERRTRFRKTR